MWLLGRIIYWCLLYQITGANYLICRHFKIRHILSVLQALLYTFWARIIYILHFWPRNTWHVLNAPAPNSKKNLRRLVRDFRRTGTCQDRRKKRQAGREGIVSVLTQQNIDDVSWKFQFIRCLCVSIRCPISLMSNRPGCLQTLAAARGEIRSWTDCPPPPTRKLSGKSWSFTHLGQFQFTHFHSSDLINVCTGWEGHRNFVPATTTKGGCCRGSLLISESQSALIALIAFQASGLVQKSFDFWWMLDHLGWTRHE